MVGGSVAYRTVVAAAAVAGAMAVGYVASAGFVGGSTDEGASGTVSEIADERGGITPAIDDPPEVFGDTVSAATETAGSAEVHEDQGAVVQVHRGVDSDVCLSIVTTDGEISSCSSPANVRTGLAMIEIGGHDGAELVVGIVPDEVSEVLVNGEPVAVKNNSWIYKPKSSDSALSIEVRSEDGRRATAESDGP